MAAASRHVTSSSGTGMRERYCGWRHATFPAAVFDAPGDVLVADALFWLLGWFIRAVHAFVALLVVLVI
jgi:hypothetical protein